MFERTRILYEESMRGRIAWWGIAMNTRAYEELKVETGQDRVTIHRGRINEDIARIFGLRIIPKSRIPYDKMYLVDEELGRILLGDKDPFEAMMKEFYNEQAQKY